MFSTLKVKRSQKFVWGLSNGIHPGTLQTIRLKLRSKNFNLEVKKLMRRNFLSIKSPNSSRISIKILGFSLLEINIDIYDI
jgi:hypothetical protein